jgi:hypothetical protein
MTSFAELEVPVVNGSNNSNNKARDLLPSPTRSNFSADSNSNSASSSGGVGVLANGFGGVGGRPQRAPSLRSGSNGPGAVAALRGLFAGGTRPRSPSAATMDGRSTPDGAMAQSLFGVLAQADASHSSTMTERPFSPVTVNTSGLGLASIPFEAEPSPYPPYLDRRIVADPSAALAAAADEAEAAQLSSPISMSPQKALRPIGTGSSLQPPPRKRPWTMLSAPPGTVPMGYDTVLSPTSGTVSPQSPDTGTGHGLSAIDLSSNHSQTHSHLSHSAFGSGALFGTPEQKPRPPSLYSVSTLASASMSLSADHTSVHASEHTSSSSNNRRLSTRGLPKRATPPVGPPPTPPMVAASASGATNGGAVTPSTLLMPHPYASVGRTSAGRPKSAGAPPSPQSLHVPSPPLSSAAKRRMSNPGTSAAAAAAGSPLINGTSRGLGMGRFGNSNKRASMPPPQRPLPNAALPPTPPTPLDDTHSPTISHLSIQAVSTPQPMVDEMDEPTLTMALKAQPLLPSVATATVTAMPPAPAPAPAPAPTLMRRAFRLSLNPPTRPPPAGALPPPPSPPAQSDQYSRGHSRRASVGATVSAKPTSNSWSSPSFRSLSPPSPAPRPAVPDTPTGSTMPALPSSPTLAGVAAARTHSLRQRLRHLSSPMPTSSTSSVKSTPDHERVITSTLPLSSSRTPSPAPSASASVSVRAPTLGERIIPCSADMDALARSTWSARSVHSSTSREGTGSSSSPGHSPNPSDESFHSSGMHGSGMHGSGMNIGMHGSGMNGMNGNGVNSSGIRSLPPPPRRGSRQLTASDRERLIAMAASSPHPSSPDPTQPSTPAVEDLQQQPTPSRLTRQMSSFSIGIVTATA